MAPVPHSRLAIEENARFLYSCLIRSDYHSIDFNLVARDFSINPPAARMRWTRLRKAYVEASTFKNDPHAVRERERRRRGRGLLGSMGKGGKGGKGVVDGECDDVEMKVEGKKEERGENWVGEVSWEDGEQKVKGKEEYEGYVEEGGYVQGGQKSVEDFGGFGMQTAAETTGLGYSVVQQGEGYGGEGMYACPYMPIDPALMEEEGTVPGVFGAEQSASAVAERADSATRSASGVQLTETESSVVPLGMQEHKPSWEDLIPSSPQQSCQPRQRRESSIPLSEISAWKSMHQTLISTSNRTENAVDPALTAAPKPAADQPRPEPTDPVTSVPERSVTLDTSADTPAKPQTILDLAGSIVDLIEDILAPSSPESTRLTTPPRTPSPPYHPSLQMPWPPYIRGITPTPEPMSDDEDGDYGEGKAEDMVEDKANDEDGDNTEDKIEDKVEATVENEADDVVITVAAPPSDRRTPREESIECVRVATLPTSESISKSKRKSTPGSHSKLTVREKEIKELEEMEWMREVREAMKKGENGRALRSRGDRVEKRDGRRRGQ